MNSTIKLKIRKTNFLGDIFTPVSTYLRLRDRFVNTFLLESSDYHGEENSYSYLCCKSIASFETLQGKSFSIFPTKKTKTQIDLPPLEALKSFKNTFDFQQTQSKYIETGLFGYIHYEAVSYFENIETHKNTTPIPEIRYDLFQYIIVFDHFKNDCFLIETYTDQPNDEEFNEIIDLIHKQSHTQFKFKVTQPISSNLTDNQFIENVQKGIKHCYLGDIFQIVLSRKFDISFQGDDFQVYRTLRSINPSPYLFYYDYGDYKYFGSSPEAQIEIKGEKASIYPIAGTFRRTGNDESDAILAKQLLADEKENSEHIMLVDLARNDLGRNTEHVTLEADKTLQFYSHVIHMVSKVSGKFKKNTEILNIVADTFPAGTLSGAPKIKAMQIIHQIENSPRRNYGGAIGFMDFSNTFNHAIMIRTFFSYENKLHFQAGAGVVAKSVPQNELQEVYNKVAALQKAIEMAENI